MTDKDRLEKLLFCLDVKIKETKDFEQEKLTPLANYLLEYCFGTERVPINLSSEEVNNLLVLGNKVNSFCASWKNTLNELEQIRNEISKQLEEN